MDTLGCASAVIALILHIFSSPRALKIVNISRDSRSTTISIVILVFSALALALGYFGYHKDWPRWANGRAVGAIFIGALLLVITILELTTGASVEMQR